MCETKHLAILPTYFSIQDGVGSRRENIFLDEFIETSETAELLKTFQLSDAAIECFLANSYTLDDLKIIERDEVEALLPSPFLADRTRAIYGLNKWRISQNLIPLTIPLAEKPANFNSDCKLLRSKNPLDGTDKKQWTARLLIERSKRGKEVIKKYDKCKILAKKDKTFITHLIVDEFVDEFGKLSKDELIQRAKELNEIFPTIDEHVWYQPTTIRDVNGRKIKLSRLARGCLFDRNHNYRAAAVLEKGDNFGSIDHICYERKLTITEDSCTEEAVASYNETKRWFRHHQDEWEDLRVRWTASSSVRLYEISKIKLPSFEHILDEYPIMRNNDGYQLIKIDFNHRYPDKNNLLFERFVEFRTRIQPILYSDVGDQGRSLLKLLEENHLEDIVDCVTFILLVHILPNSTLRLPNGKRWKPSIRESCDGILIHLKALDEYEKELSRIYQQNSLRGLPDHPLIVVVCDELKSIEQFFVTYRDISYKVETFLKAVDIIFKIHKAYDIVFPPEVKGLWQFIAYFMYNFDLTDDSFKARILSLSNTIRLLETSQ
ncbi:uncharacterized protein LOC131434053 [Malaya genurostris]|uniref:uncharacterized protein LOC131434053 n=1 Tax=Malaya genurostris TaxID=325434 RepID=UPI0026F3ABA7|nr:uncharacterized protein LOC131434053 [Malaya genurostris]